jgi:heme-degrading monooxygenase HmoA
MIARIRHGKTSIKKYNVYSEFLKQVAIPDYQKSAGLEGMTFLRNIVNNEGHFCLITFWTSIEAIKNYAGPDFEKPKYFPEERGFLLELEDKVHHYEVFV